MLFQLVSLAGAAMVLLAYVGYQRGWMSREQRRYSLLNFVGSSLLAWVAVVDQRWGFIALEVIWALVSLPPLLRSRGRSEGPAGEA